MENYRVYAKFAGQTQFQALDLSKGTQVKNLIYATIVPSENLGKLEIYLNSVKEEQPEINFKIVKI